MSELPTWLLTALGFLFVSNLAVVFTILTFIFKAGMFVATTRSNIDDAKDMAVRAHLRIDEVRKDIKDMHA